MAQVDVEGVVDHLRSEFRRALRDTLNDLHVSEAIDEQELFRTFRRQIRKKCSSWESIPDSCISD